MPRLCAALYTYLVEGLPYDCLFDHDQDDGPEDDDEYGLFFITFGEPFA